MPKKISSEEKMEVIHLILDQDEDGKYLYGQRQISSITGLSRPYIQKIALSLGHQFPRNGVENLGMTCCCANCECFFYKARSRVARAEKQFCDEDCRKAFTKGPNHPSWKTGKTANSFSKWVVNQSEYHEWRKAVLERAGNRCEVSGATEDLQCHHIMHKAENCSPEKAFDISNGLVMSKESHIEIHKITKSGVSFNEAVKMLREKYNYHPQAVQKDSYE